MLKASRGGWAAISAPLFVAFLLAEFLVFDQLGARHHTRVYPRWNDQIQYLTEAYTAFEASRGTSLLDALWGTLTNPSAQGTLHDFYALGVFSLAGPSRSAALSVNMLLFLAWQALVFAWMMRRTQSHAAAWIAASLCLLLSSGWNNGPGSAFDFRLDWPALCMMGASMAALGFTEGLTARRHSVFFGAAVGLTLLTRFLTGAYFATGFLFLAMWAGLTENRWVRLGNLTLAASLALAIAGPALWLNREHVYNYYLIGHFTGPESAIRSPDFGIWKSFVWLTGHLASQHLGAVFLWTSAGVIVASGAAILFSKGVGPGHPRFSVVAERRPLLLPLVFVVGPGLILILHTQKSELVVGILVPGVLFALLEVIARLSRSASDRWLTTTAVATVGFAAATYLTRVAPNPHPPGFQASAATVNFIADEIVARSRSHGLTQPRVAVDRVTDSLDAQVLRVICYERHRRWTPFIMTLPYGIQRTGDDLIMSRLEESDFVILTEEASRGLWPSDHQLEELRPRTHAWAKRHLSLVRSFDMFGGRFTLWEKPGPTAIPPNS